MSPALYKETQYYKQILMMLLMLAAVTVSGCLGLLWLRQKIEFTAQATRLLEIEIAKEERRLRYLDTKIAEIHQPLFLERQIQRFGLNLRPPQSDQIVYMEGYRGVEPPFDQEPAGTPGRRGKDAFRHSIDLAVMESLRPVD